MPLSPLAVANLAVIFALALSPWTQARADDAPQKPPRMTWEERFTAANTAHDGHLTLEEAKTGYKTVARHFAEIDASGKGYVTENDIRAWHAQQKASRHAHESDDPLKPRPAYSRSPTGQIPTAGSNQTMLMPPAVQVPAKATLDHPAPEN